MVTKNDVMEMHDQLVALKNSRDRMKKLVLAFNSEIDKTDAIIENLENDYRMLKKKADK